MTEEEWLTSRDIFEAFLFLRAPGQRRKWDLFSCSCLRRFWAILYDDRVKDYVEAVERNPGTSDEQDLEAAWAACSAAFDEMPEVETAYRLSGVMTEYPCELDPSDVAEACAKVRGDMAVAEGWSTWRKWTDEMMALREKAIGQEEVDQQLLRLDIFGNPFRPVTFSPSWRTDTAVSLAQGMYESRDFSAMPILADALQDAGCDNDDVLGHCRGPGPHVRGCWVVDLVLGKE